MKGGEGKRWMEGERQKQCESDIYFIYLQIDNMATKQFQPFQC